MEIRLINHTPNPEEAIIRAAANCWQSTPRAGILDHIIRARHWTPLEFASFNFEIAGVSRVLTHQLVRKRAGVAFAQESQRCVDQANFDYVTPPSIKNCSDLNARQVFIDRMRLAQAAYEQLLDVGIPAEDARYVLPSACTGSIHMTINYHALLDLAKERLCGKAQWEIRQLVYGLKTAVTGVSPKLGGYLQPKCYWLGGCPEKAPCGKGEEYEPSL